MRSGAAPTGAGRTRQRQLVDSGRTPPTGLPADRRRPARPFRGADELARVLGRRHEPARTAPGDAVISQRGRHSLGADPAARVWFSVDDYLAQVAGALSGPSRTRAAILAELRAGLLDAVEAHRQTGLASRAAEEAAARVIGDPRQLAAAFGAEPATAKARRLALLLLASVPLIMLAWAAAAIGSHLGARNALSWQWDGASPAWRLTLLVAAAALLIGVFAATAAVAVSGRLTRSLPDSTRFAAKTAITAGLAAAAVDVILLLLLARQLAHAPETLDTTPVTIAAVASITRLVFAQRSIRRSRPLEANGSRCRASITVSSPFRLEGRPASRRACRR
jgi:hypothetical protein